MIRLGGAEAAEAKPPLSDAEFQRKFFCRVSDTKAR